MPVSRNRLRIVVISICLCFAIVFVRVYYLVYYLDSGKSSTSSTQIIRGKIEDRRGFALARTIGTSTIAIAPAEIYDIEKTAEILANHLTMPLNKILERFYYNKNRKYFYLVRQVDDLVADQIMDLHLPGVHRERHYRRQYPAGALASNLIGFVGHDQAHALEGLELSYNGILTGETQSARQGNTIQLSIDALMQHRLEKELGVSYEASGARRGAGILMNIQTGEILAMASVPNFNPNEYFKSTDFQRGNWNIRFNYEPGSTIKVFMAAILLAEAKARPDERFLCDGEIHFHNSSVACRRRGRIVKHGYLSLTDIIRKSCNVGIIKAMQRIPPDRLHYYMTALGFGQRSDILPPNSGETTGYFPNLQNWVKSTSYYTPIGQGFSVTPIQLIRAGASIANGGRLLQPIVVRRVVGERGKVINESFSYKTKNPFPPAVNQKVIQMMEGVVQSGTGRAASVPGLRIAGKTGTGEKSSASGYLGKYVVSFMGFFPAEKPRYGMLILFDEPRGSHSGGSLAAPTFARIVMEIQPYLFQSTRPHHTESLPPLKVQSAHINPARLHDFRGLSARDAIQIISGYYDSTVELKGSGYVYRQNPAPGTASAHVKQIILYLNDLH